MKNLFEAINVTTDKKQAQAHAAKISHTEWQEEESQITIMERLGIDGLSSEFNDFWEGVDVVESCLSHTAPDETVYFWID